MKNYYEHETKVKFSDGLLSLSKDWQWFIDQTEADFQGFTANTTTWVEFLNSYAKEITDVSKVNVGIPANLINVVKDS